MCQKYGMSTDVSTGRSDTSRRRSYVFLDCESAGDRFLCIVPTVLDKSSVEKTIEVTAKATRRRDGTARSRRRRILVSVSSGGGGGLVIVQAACVWRVGVG